ncbi:MAG: glutamate 5-kinase [Actinomycetota bacterium]
MIQRLAGAKRVVVKVGTSSIVSAAGVPDEARLLRITEQIAVLRSRGVEVVVVSSGSIAAGMAALGLRRRPTDMPTLQAAAALGAVPVVNENDTVATEEIRYGDNDRIAALVANIVRADLLVLLSDVEGVYTEHPANPGAVLLSTIKEVTPAVVGAAAKRGSSLGSGGMASKLEAAQMATLSGVGVVIAFGERPDCLLDVWSGAEVGTFFPARGPRQAARKLWIAWGPTARGRIVIDDGACRAVSKGNKSLLAAGVQAVEGAFKAGDAVEVVGPQGELVAKGLVAFDSDLLADLIGTKGGREVIHRDQLVVL